jgi:hypothetical protein
MFLIFLNISVFALAVGVFLALDNVVLVAGVSGILFCLSILAENFEASDLP